MKPIIYHKYSSSDDLELHDIDEPVVKDDEVLKRLALPATARVRYRDHQGRIGSGLGPRSGGGARDTRSPYARGHGLEGDWCFVVETG